GSVEQLCPVAFRTGLGRPAKCLRWSSQDRAVCRRRERSWRRGPAPQRLEARPIGSPESHAPQGGDEHRCGRDPPAEQSPASPTSRLRTRGGAREDLIAGCTPPAGTEGVGDPLSPRNRLADGKSRQSLSARAVSRSFVLKPAIGLLKRRVKRAGCRLAHEAF